MNTDEYLKRIGCEECTVPSLENLRKLQHAHLLRVPYESFDLYRGEIPDLSAESLFDKIVTRRRGGYCFELNGAFRNLLAALGYEVRQYFGRWLYGEALAMPPPRHRALRVRCEGREFVTDVGIGMHAPLEPLEFVYDRVQRCAGTDWRIIRDPRFVNLVQMCVKGVWMNYYAFGEEPAEDIDFVYVNQYLATEPSSMFRRGFLTYVQLEDGAGRSLRPELDPETGTEAWCYRQFAVDGSVRVSYLHTSASRADALESGFSLPRDLG